MSTHLETLQGFRQDLNRSFPYRRDSILDLLDALSSNERVHSPVELSLNQCFRRQHGALYQAIDAAYCESEFPVCSSALVRGALLPSRSLYQRQIPSPNPALSLQGCSKPRLNSLQSALNPEMN